MLGTPSIDCYIAYSANPISLATSKFASAVISGNTIIIKPSPYTPYSCLKLFELAQEIFPPGVIQVIGGTDDLGPMLTAHPDVAKISFTGSIATGKKIMQACSKTLKRVTLELYVFGLETLITANHCL